MIQTWRWKPISANLKKYSIKSRIINIVILTWDFTMLVIFLSRLSFYHFFFLNWQKRPSICYHVVKELHRLPTVCADAA